MLALEQQDPDQRRAAANAPNTPIIPAVFVEKAIDPLELEVVVAECAADEVALADEAFSVVAEASPD